MATLYRNGRVHTMDPTNPVAESILTDNGAIVAVGADSDVLDQVGSRACEEVDLRGQAVIPGLIDAHIHSASFAREMNALDLRGARSLPEALEQIRSYAARLEPGRWVFGGRWDSNTWDLQVQPDRSSLDSVCPDRPVALPSVDGHTIWANSRALRAVGIDRTSVDPIGGEIVRDETGEPTGILRESARYPLRDLMGSPLAGDLIDQILVAQNHLLSLGLTGIHDIDGEDAREAYLRLREQGRLKLRVHKAIPAPHLDAAIEEGRRTGQGDEWFSTGPVKFFADGALGSHTAHMTEPFAGEGGNRGIEVIPYPDLVELVRKAARAGIAVATHAIGDQANRLVLAAYAEVLDVSQKQGLRHRIEHAQHIPYECLPEFARLGVVPSLQPTHCTSDIPLTESLLAGRSLANYASRSLLDSGAMLAFGSDAPVEDPNPFHALHAAVTRQNAAGEPDGGWEPHQRISVSEAIAAHTSGPAYAAGLADRLGQLRPGWLADFITVNADPFAVSPKELRDLEVTMTVVGGDLQFCR
ncbi:MAG: amidohydrolase [Aeromicrobium sp.]